MSASQRAVVALGANLGDRASTLRSACDALGGIGRVVACSRFYETAPVGPPQPMYLNAVALVDTRKSPHEVLDALLEIERRFGRERGERWGPRTLDLDLIALGQAVIDTPGLSLPHPEAARRAFVLVPLCEVAPDWTFPDGQTARQLASALDEASVAGVRPSSASGKPSSTNDEPSSTPESPL